MGRWVENSWPEGWLFWITIGFLIYIFIINPLLERLIDRIREQRVYGCSLKDKRLSEEDQWQLIREPKTDK